MGGSLPATLKLHVHARVCILKSCRKGDHLSMTSKTIQPRPKSQARPERIKIRYGREAQGFLFSFPNRAFHQHFRAPVRYPNSLPSFYIYALIYLVAVTGCIWRALSGVLVLLDRWVTPLVQVVCFNAGPGCASSRGSKLFRVLNRYSLVGCLYDLVLAREAVLAPVSTNTHLNRRF